MGFQEAKVGEMAFWAEGTTEAKQERRALETGEKASEASARCRLTFCLKRGITSLGFQEDLYGIGVGAMEVGRDWS